MLHQVCIKEIFHDCFRKSISLVCLLSLDFEVFFPVKFFMELCAAFAASAKLKRLTENIIIIINPKQAYTKTHLNLLIFLLCK